MRENNMKKIMTRETVRVITFDRIVISVVEITVSRKNVLENFIIEDNEMITVVGGKFSVQYRVKFDSKVTC